MLKLWEQVGTSLATRLLTASEFALVFWVWFTFWWAVGHGGWAAYAAATAPLFSDGAALLAVAAGAVIVVVVSGLIVQRAATPVLRLLEGYWPETSWREKRREAWRVKRDVYVQKEVDATPIGGLSEDSPASVAADAMKWDAKLQDFPDRDSVLPTRIGNIIRAGERRPLPTYGLDPIIVWPQLWLALPEQPRADVQDARSRLDSSVAAFIWSLLAAPAALVGLWWGALGVVVAALVALAIWRLWIPAEARAYASVLTAIFDTQRFLLYDALRLPRPKRPRDELQAGRALTRWIRRRDQVPARFAPPPP